MGLLGFAQSALIYLCFGAARAGQLVMSPVSLSVSPQRTATAGVSLASRAAPEPGSMCLVWAEICLFINKPPGLENFWFLLCFGTGAGGTDACTAISMVWGWW